MKASMTGKARAVAGTVDTVMDLTSKFIPAMQDPADWWDEKSGRKTESDPLKKAEHGCCCHAYAAYLVCGSASRQLVSPVKPS